MNKRIIGKTRCEGMLNEVEFALTGPVEKVHAIVGFIRNLKYTMEDQPEAKNIYKY